MSKKTIYDAAGFYDDISAEYDEMFGFEKDLADAEKFIAVIKDDLKPDRALDIGCGTGSFTLSLAKSGIEAIGIDISKAMIDEAEQNNRKYKLDAGFVNCGIAEMQDCLEEKFDLILCMGNILPHLLNKNELYHMLNSAADLLNPGGQLVINLLNYDRILSTKDRIVGITRQEDQEFIRFYDFEDPYVDFNLLEIKWNKGKPEHKIISTKLYPYVYNEIESALLKAGFDDLKIFEGLQFSSYDLQKSKSVTIIALIKQ